MLPQHLSQRRLFTSSTTATCLSVWQWIKKCTGRPTPAPTDSPPPTRRLCGGSPPRHHWWTRVSMRRSRPSRSSLAAARIRKKKDGRIHPELPPVPLQVQPHHDCIDRRARKMAGESCAIRDYLDGPRARSTPFSAPRHHEALGRTR